MPKGCKTTHGEGEEMINVRLLNDGGFSGFDEVEFPVSVCAVIHSVDLVKVSEDELKRIGCDMKLFNDANDPYWPFSIPNGECEVVS